MTQLVEPLLLIVIRKQTGKQFFLKHTFTHFNFKQAGNNTIPGE